MSIRSGAIIHSVKGMVIDRLQTGGVSSLNIPQQKIDELGNWLSLQYIRDIPDLSFDLESLDVSTEIEALITAADPTSVVNGQEFDFNDSVPFDVISPWKARRNNFTVAGGVIIPNLYLENCTYRFGLRQNATQQFTFKGDGLTYLAGAPKAETFTLVNNTLTYNLSGNADIIYNDQGTNAHVTSACVINPTTKAYRRLFISDDYTDTTTSITVLHDWFDDGYTQLNVTYGSTDATTYPQSVHQGVDIKPAAVRGKDLDLYLSNYTATATLGKWSGVQSFEVSRKVALQADEEFGNEHYIDQDYDTPDVSGNIVIRPVDVATMIDKIQQVAGVASTRQAGPNTDVQLELELRVYKPGDHTTVLKTLYVPDARIQIPAYQGRVNQKNDVTFPFTSDSGSLFVYKGLR